MVFSLRGVQALLSNCSNSETWFKQKETSESPSADCWWEPELGRENQLRLVVEIPFIYIYLFFWLVISNIFLCLPLYLGFYDPIWPSFFNHQDKVSKAFAKHNHPWSRFTKVKSWSDARLRFVGKGQTPGRVVEVVSRGAEFPHFLVLGKIHCKIWVFPKIPKMDSLWWLKWMIWGYHYFWKHPFTLW